MDCEQIVPHIHQAHRLTSCPDMVQKTSFFLLSILVAAGVGNSQAHGVQRRQTAAACSINLETDMPLYQPLMLKKGSASKDLYSFVMPDQQGNVKLAASEQVRVVCSGKSNLIAKLGVADASAACAGGNSLTTASGTTLAMRDFNCSAFAAHTAKKAAEPCEIAGTGLVALNIGYELADGFYTVIKTCFDEVNKDAVYAKYLQTPAIAGQNTAEVRPSFVEGTFYPEVSVDTKYTKATQKVTVGQILGSSTLGTNYIKDIDYYLARGHLAARADFVYASHQRATFWYINTAPQWQTFNSGNWKVLEDNLRDYVVRSGKEVVVYVGTHGVATLPDANGQEKPLYLAYDPTGASAPKIKVPELFWKVLYEPMAKKAIVFVGVNNPYKSTFDKLCTDKCSQITWLTWQPSNQKAGFSYCCELNELRTKIKSIPALDATSLLV